MSPIARASDGATPGAAHVATYVVAQVAANASPFVVVFAAASLKESMDEQARAFEAKTGHKVVVSYAASSALARQIEAGAPADVVVSADSEWIDYLEQRKLLAQGTRVDLLRNSLVLVAPARSSVSLKIAPGFALASALGNDRLAMANPDTVPAGKYGKAALQSLNAWPSVERRVVRAESVRAALTLVARNEAPLGIVYSTDALADRSVRVVDTFPAATHPPIVYPGAVVASSKSAAARAFLDFLKGAEARTIWSKHGFSSSVRSGVNAAVWAVVELILAIIT